MMQAGLVYMWREIKEIVKLTDSTQKTTQKSLYYTLTTSHLIFFTRGKTSIFILKNISGDKKKNKKKQVTKKSTASTEYKQDYFIPKLIL